MNFKELYDNNKEAVVRSLTSMWCGEANDESQEAYVRQLKMIIGDVFAPDNAVPVVQCMNSYESVSTVSADEAKALVGKLWTAPYAPYEHQYQSWKTLLTETTAEGKPMSIVVTTGTGSGKTECFMMPLVHDLMQRRSSQEIQALFLYPLNALMEDQKERLEKLLEGTELTFAVYNGDLPESEPKETSTQPDDVKLRRRIEQITGGKYVANTDANGRTTYKLDTEHMKFKHMLYTRKQVRNTPPNILLTNPTMLEYILLRGADAALINPESKSLRWVVVDETHTYTGAGAAEMAMLLRRVLLAFNVDAHDVRFATSSATFGNGGDDEMKLREFISGITGIDKEQVRNIGGHRLGEANIDNTTDKQRWQMIFEREFVPLDELFGGKSTISEKLQMLDEMCRREEERTKAEGENAPDMKVKVHYFYRVPNNGFYVRLTEHADGAFKIYTQNNLDTEDKNKAPLLELSRCKHCGEYVAVGRVSKTDWSYTPLVSDDSDMFDLEATNENDDTEYAIFALSNNRNILGDDNCVFTIAEDGKLEQTNISRTNMDEWHIVGNTHCHCPHCHANLGKKKEEDEDVDINKDLQNLKLQKFRLSADFIARLVAPSILNQLDKAVAKPGQLLLHDGQQYISFVDSRQAAAQATLRQNLEQERHWFYSIIYHELCRRQAKQVDIQKELAEVMAEMPKAIADPMKLVALSTRYQELQKLQKNHITWNEIADLVRNDKYTPIFAELFVKRTSDSEELDDNGDIKPLVIEQYVQSIMVMYLANRPISMASPETMGLFATCYPQLDKIELPEAVIAFNSNIVEESNRITKNDWHNLIQIFMDYTVRSNQSVYLRLADDNPIDIFACVRFAAEKQRRRPAHKPKLERGKTSAARIVRYLCALIARDNKSISLNEVQNVYFDEIEGVVNALWDTVTNPDNHLLGIATRWNTERNQHLKEKKEEDDGVFRLNLANLSFKLYDDVYLCDVNASSEIRSAVCLRPIENHFKRFSPYMNGSMPVELKEELHDTWKPFPYLKADGTETPLDVIHNWAKKERKLLWDNRLWGEDGTFANRLDEIHQFPNLFIQAEHTAQVDKEVARGRQTEFKKHGINILACSTTMEMGVDLGNLEVVMLTSVPPMPANYKQRAGRSGRNNKVRSACITLCGSDAIGLRTLYDPLAKIINREVQVPTVDLKSPQVIQRHVNSYLVRAFGVFTDGANGGSLNQKVVDYYTPFEMVRSGDNHLTIIDRNVSVGEVEPTAKLGDPQLTMYEHFNKECDATLTPELHNELDKLLKDTIFDGQINHVVEQAKKANTERYNELNIKLEDYKFAYNQAVTEGRERFRTKIKMQYMEVMNERLLNYWATHRFTPNANMPVNVLTLDLNSTTGKNFFTQNTSSNPSYSLREAIAQYAPGNCVAVDGVVYIVRGIEHANMYEGNRAFKTIYRNADKTVIDNNTALPNMKKWEVNGQNGLELIQPTSFLPDRGEAKSRIVEPNTFTHVSAQLIDTDDWADTMAEPHLFSVRSNRDTGNAKILYYNEGKGFGYCFCKKCGRMVLEQEAADTEDTTYHLPPDFNPMLGKLLDNGERKPNFHNAIAGKDAKKPCSGSHHKDSIRRNVIIGDLIQTDYSEIRLRYKGNTQWLSNRDQEKNLLFTLGIVFTQSLADILGKERSAVDFAIMPNGHLCIFDTNPGGAGYANQMTNIEIMKKVIKASKIMLEEAKANSSKDMLLDRFTLRFAEYIDIDAALGWINEEKHL